MKKSWPSSIDFSVKDKITSLINKSRISETPAILDFRGGGGGYIGQLI